MIAKLIHVHTALRALWLEYFNTDLLALVAEVVGILGHGILEWLLVELGGRRGDLFTLHLVLILETQPALAFYVLVELGYGLLYITQRRM